MLKHHISTDYKKNPYLCKAFTPVKRQKANPQRYFTRVKTFTEEQNAIFTPVKSKKVKQNSLFTAVKTLTERENNLFTAVNDKKKNKH